VNVWGLRNVQIETAEIVPFTETGNVLVSRKKVDEIPVSNGIEADGVTEDKYPH
jgi:hypothetical protein